MSEHEIRHIKAQRPLKPFEADKNKLWGAGNYQAQRSDRNVLFSSTIFSQVLSLSSGSLLPSERSRCPQHRRRQLYKYVRSSQCDRGGAWQLNTDHLIPSQATYHQHLPNSSHSLFIKYLSTLPKRTSLPLLYHLIVCFFFFFTTNTTLDKSYR